MFIINDLGGRQIGSDNTLKNNYPLYDNTLNKSDPLREYPTLHNAFLENRTYYEGLGMGKS